MKLLFIWLEIKFIYYRESLEFYDLRNLYQSKVTCNITKKHFGTIHGICASSSIVLWCMNSSFEGDKVELEKLECSSSPPTVTHKIKISPYVRVPGPQGMCCVEEGNRTLIVTSQLFIGLTAYNTQTGEIEWTIAGYLEDGKNLSTASLTKERSHFYRSQWIKLYRHHERWTRPYFCF